MKGNEINDVLQLGARHALYREDGKWFHNLKKFPGVLIDKRGYVRFDDEESYKSEPKLKRRKDLNIPAGIESLESYQQFTVSQRQLIFANEIFNKRAANDSEVAIRFKREIDIILRNRQLVGRIKKLYKNTSQVCGIQIKIGRGKYYSEVHHIVPLGRPHNGVDNASNMICVCPNCHVLLDFGVIKLVMNSFMHFNHSIDSRISTIITNIFLQPAKQRVKDQWSSGKSSLVTKVPMPIIPSCTQFDLEGEMEINLDEEELDAAHCLVRLT